MNKQAISTASLVAVLALGGLAAGVSAQEVAEEADPAATSKSVTGVITEGVDEDGKVTYYLTPKGGEPIELSYGPSWLWGKASPLDQFVDSTVTVLGQLRDHAPNDNASEMAQAQAADRMPMMRVRAVVGPELRSKGRPPWAGGPKNEDLGEVHPGFEGWSKGQAQKPADEGARAAEKAAKAEARAAEKAVKAAARAEAKAAKAEARAARAEQRAAERAEKKGNRP